MGPFGSVMGPFGSYDRNGRDHFVLLGLNFALIYTPLLNTFSMISNAFFLNTLSMITKASFLNTIPMITNAFFLNCVYGFCCHLTDSDLIYPRLLIHIGGSWIAK